MVLKVIIIILIVLCVFLLIAIINHKIKLKREEEFLTPIGQMVDVDGYRMCVYSEGSGDKTLVFMSGLGTVSPILDFQSLYPLLSDEYRIVVVEKFGYGFSDQVDKSRDVASILEDTRVALSGAGIEGPYILCPHSLSGIEALYWAHTYPDEVEAIIGLDMDVPESYDHLKIGSSYVLLTKLIHGLIDLGIGRFVPDSAYLPLENFFSEDEVKTYAALFNRNYMNVDIAREGEAINESAVLVASKGKPNVPMLLFVSDGTGGTGMDIVTWRGIVHDYTDDLPNATVIELDCSHYIHHYEAERISEEIDCFLQENQFLGAENE